MTDEELTRGELLDKLETLRKRVAELEQMEVDRKQAEKARVDALEAEKQKLDKELELRYNQLKASEEELKQTRTHLKTVDAEQKAQREKLSVSEQLLHESEGHYRHLVESLPGMLAVQDVQAKKYVFWNKEVGWSGYTLEEYNKLSREQKRELIHRDDLPRYLKAFGEWEESPNGKPLSIEYRIRHKDGFFRWLQMVIFKEVADDGTVLAQMELSWDISDRMDAVEDARHDRERFELIAASQRDLIYKLDAEDKYIFASPSFCETFGRKEDDLLGKKYTPPIHQDDFEATTKTLKSLRKEPHHAYVEFRSLTKDGWRWFGWYLETEVNNKGEVLSTTAVGADISDRKHLEAELEAVKAEVDHRVGQRTTELNAANKELVKQIENLKTTGADTLETQANLKLLLESFKDYLFELDDGGRMKHVNPDVLKRMGKSEDEVLRTLEMMHQAGEAQRKSRNNLQMMFNALDDFLFVLDSKGRILHFNATVENRLDYSVEELLGMNILEVHPPNQRDEASALLAEIVAGKTQSHTIPLLTRDKTLIPVETKLSLGRWDDKNVLIAYSRDITGRMIANRKLEESERKFRMLVEQSAVGVCILQDDLIRYINPAFVGMLGYSAEEMMSWTSIYLEHIVHPDDREEYLKQRRRRRAAKPDELQRYTFRAVTSEGEIRWLNLYTKSVVYETSPAELVTVVDITDFRHAEDARINQELRKLSDSKVQALERLAGAVAHEFNELLTIIKGHSQMGLMSLHEKDPIRKDLEDIDQAAETGSELTWKLLAFAGRHNWEPAILDINETLAGMEEVLQRVLGKNIDLEFIPGDDLQSIKIDEDQLERVVMNLAMNARDAIVENGKTTLETENVTIDEQQARIMHLVPMQPGMQGMKPGQYVQLTFSDNGRGIPYDLQRDIFDPYFTLRGDVKGSGLGLSTVYGIVKKCGGHIHLDSHPNDGATFTLYFPIAREEDKLEIATPKPARIPGRGETVLVVEDDDAVREMATQILRWHGYRVLEAGSGKKAYQMCQEMSSPVNMVVSDVYMPNMSGGELADKLRKLWKDLPILFISGATADKSLDPSIPLLRKPFPPTELVKCVQEMLAAR